MRGFTSSAAVAVLALPCLCQDYIGFTHNCNISATSRGALGVNAGEVMARIDGDEFAGWGTTTPGRRTISALTYVMQDQNGATPEASYDIKLYPEDPQNAGYPDLANGVTFRSGLMFPVGSSGPVAYSITVPAVVGVGDSVPIQGGGDVFVSWVLPANGNWYNDGLSIYVVVGYPIGPIGFYYWDIPGLAQGGSPPPPAAPWNSHGLSRTGTGAAIYNSRRMLLVDVAHNSSGGTALTITNQASFPASNGSGAAPGTASMMSGSNPDVVGGNPGRVDNIAMWYFRNGFGNNNLVAFVADIGGFGPETPVTALGVTGSGVLCLNPATMMVLGFGLSNSSQAWLVTAVPAASRPTLAGLPLVQQAAGLDSAAGAIHPSSCRRQVF